MSNTDKCPICERGVQDCNCPKAAYWARIGQLEKNALALAESFALVHKEADAELGRWQNEIARVVTELCGVHVDGSGTDSGDPLDLTLNEIREGFHVEQESADHLGAVLLKYTCAFDRMYPMDEGLVTQFIKEAREALDGDDEREESESAHLAASLTHGATDACVWGDAYCESCREQDSCREEDRQDEIRAKHDEQNFQCEEGDTAL
jgi:hypothetical protein